MTANSDPLPAAVLRRKAVVYVRQSTQSQVQTNLESKGLLTNKLHIALPPNRDDHAKRGLPRVDPWAGLSYPSQLPHPGIALPPQLYGAARANSPGVDFGLQRELQGMQRELAQRAARSYQAGPPAGEAVVVTNPANANDRLGEVRFASPADVELAFAPAAAAWPAWNARCRATRHLP